MNAKTIIDELDHFRDILKSLDKLVEKYSGLLTIRDELLADADQLQYLLTFQ